MVGVRASASVGPEAKVYDALAAAVADPKDFSKRLKALAEQTQAYEDAKVAADAAATKAHKERTEADRAMQAAAKAQAALAEREGVLKQAQSVLNAGKQSLSEAQAAFNAEAKRQTADLDVRANASKARDARLGEAEIISKQAMKDALDAKQEWEARRDKLLEAMK